MLNVENDIHMFCLHYVYLPRLNRALHQFVEAWNYHPMSSMGNLSPIQIWIAGLSRNSTDEAVNDDVSNIIIIVTLCTAAF